jgi:hypothetical protein
MPSQHAPNCKIVTDVLIFGCLRIEVSSIGADMGRKKRIRGSVGECVYCGKVARLTPDHVPPKNLFLTPRPSNLITVPSCEGCNGGASKDDEYFKNMIMLRQDVGNHSEATQLLSEVMASLRRPEQAKFTRSMLTGMTPVELTTPAGVYIGKTMAINVKLDRVRRVLNRTVRGLFYHERKQRLPTNCIVSSFTDIDLPDPRIMSLLASQPPKTIGSGVFSYRSLFTEDERYGSAWLLIFYEAVRVVSMTLPLARTT